MTKIVYNGCYGGFGLSEEGKHLYLKKKGIKYTKEKTGYYPIIGYRYVDEEGNEIDFYDIEEERSDPILVEVVEELKEKSWGMGARLLIEEIPEGVQYRIDEYDGLESVMTRDSYDWKTA